MPVPRALRSRPSVPLLLAVVLLVAGLEFAPRFLGAQPSAWPGATGTERDGFLDRWDSDVAQDRSDRSAQAAARAVGARAIDNARAYLALPRTPAELDGASRASIEQRFDDALAIAHRVLEVPQPVEAQIRAHDIAGYAALQQAEFARAIRHFTQASTLAQAAAGLEPDRVAGHRAYWLAQAAFAAGEFALAEQSARSAIGALDRYVVFHDARFLAERAALAQPERTAGAIPALEQLLATYPEYPRQDRVTLDLAAAQFATGDLRGAMARVDAWEWAHPFHAWSSEAQALLEALEAAGVARPPRTIDESRERGRQMRLTRHWSTARPLLAHALGRCVDAGYPLGTCNAIRLQIVLNEYDSAAFEASLAMMDVIDANGGSGVSAQERAKWRARALSRIGREQEAYAVLDAYWSRRGQRARDREMGEFAADLGMYDVALEHYRRLWSRREFETFDGAFMAYLAGEFTEAAELFGITARRASGTNTDRALYWLARTYEALGRIDEARSTYADVATRNPVSYYALQARNRAEEWEATLAANPQATARVDQPGRIHWHGRTGAPRASLADARMTATAELFEPYAPSVQSPGAVDAFAADWGTLFPDAAVAAALVRIGALEPARQVFRESLTEFYMLDGLFADGRRPSERRPPIRLGMQRWEHEIDNRRRGIGWWGIRLDSPRYPIPDDAAGRSAAGARQLAIYEQRAALREPFRAAARELSDHFMVRRLAMRHASLPNLLSPSADLRGWLEAYPHAYGHLAEPSMVEHDLNPYLLWSLMIVESDLNPDSISHADAYGLLQVIPKTGELIATGFGEPDFGIHDVVEIDDAFRYGAWYLDQLLYKFDGQEMLAAVAYNAGPHQVARWIDWRGDVLDMDELIETVPYDGARRYPQRLLRYLLTYRLAYGESDRVYIGNALDPDYEDNIYY